MSADHDKKPYSQLYINAWTLISVGFSIALFFIYAFGAHLMHVGGWVWDLIRWICRPII